MRASLNKPKTLASREAHCTRAVPSSDEIWFGTLPEPVARAGRVLRYSGRLLDGAGAVFGRKLTACDCPLSAGAYREKVERECARVYGADRSLALVHGASSGLQALLVALLDEASCLVVPRNAHRSVLAGLILSGARPIFVGVREEHRSKILLPPSTEDVRSALADVNGPADVLLTRPTYEGVCVDLQGMQGLLRAAGGRLFLDEAHGAHLGFHERCPASGLSSGADVVVQSTQKTLSALTQVAVMHANGERAQLDDLSEAVARLSADVPFLPFLTSLLAAVIQIREEGADLLQKAIQVADEVRDAIRAVDGLSPLQDCLRDRAELQLDPLKVTVVIEDPEVDPQEMAVRLERTLGVGVELASARSLLLMFGPGSRLSDARRISDALRSARHMQSKTSERSLDVLRTPSPGPSVMTPRVAVLSPSQLLPAQQAVGRICGWAVVPYPPGIPVLLPGEVVTGEVVEYLQWRHAEAQRRTLPPVCGFDGRLRVVKGITT